MESDLQEPVFTIHSREHGVNILKHRYSLIEKFILTILEEEGPSSYNYVNFCISDKLVGMFEGQVSRYVDCVKIDLEERQIIERVPHSRSHKIRIKR